MSVITGDNTRAVLDSIAKQKQILDTAVGTETTASTILKGMQDNADRIKGFDEDTVADCHTQFVSEKDKMASVKTKINHSALQSLESHIRRLADKSISEYWEAEQYPTYRIAPEAAQIMRAIGFYIKAALVFPPVTAMGSFLVTGAGAGTFTDGNAIDGNLYGPANCELEVTAAGGASVTLTATVTGKDENGATVTGSGSFSTANVGDKVDVTPDQTGKKFQDITNITISDGAADDAFKIQSKVDRAVSL